MRLGGHYLEDKRSISKDDEWSLIRRHSPGILLVSKTTTDFAKVCKKSQTGIQYLTSLASQKRRWKNVVDPARVRRLDGGNL